MKTEDNNYKKYFLAAIAVVLLIGAVSVGWLFFKPSITGAVTGLGCQAKQGSEVSLYYVNAIVTQQQVKVVGTNIEEEAVKSGLYSPFNSYEPVTLIAGSNDTIVGLSENIIGMRKGEEKTFVVPPEKAYGQYDPKLQVQVPLKSLSDELGIASPQVGMVVPTSAGNAILTSFDSQNAILDYNNQLAGQSFAYLIKIVDIKC